MIRVLQIGMTNNLGGIENYIMNYYHNIDKNQIQFDFVNIYSNDLCFQDELESMGSKIYKVTSYYKHPIKYMRELKHIIKQNNYEIVHCNMNSAVFLYPLIASKCAGAKVIISHSHNSSSDKGIVKDFLHFINKHFIPLFANTYFACSDKAGQWFFNKKIMNSVNYFNIYNAIEIEKYKYNNQFRIEVRKQMKIDDDTLVIGHVGRFNKQKNHEFMIKLAYKLHKSHPEFKFKFMLIGDGPLKNEIVSSIINMNLKDYVILTGARNDVNKLMCGMDCFILPSLYEGLPLVGIEAQICGLPCIVSDKVTHELQITDTMEFSAIDNMDIWVNKIIKLKNYCDRSIILNSKIKLYDINSASIRLKKIYIQEKEKKS